MWWRPPRAFEDTRFAPIASSELSRLSVSVTLLTNFERCAHPLDWDLGAHGIRIAFTHNGKRYGATYLPDVPCEQGWNKVETMVSLMRKAGWNGRREEWRDVLTGNVGGSRGLGLGWGRARGEEGEVVRYRGDKVGVGYGVWREWRGWVESG